MSIYSYIDNNFLLDRSTPQAVTNVIRLTQILYPKRKINILDFLYDLIAWALSWIGLVLIGYFIEPINIRLTTFTEVAILYTIHLIYHRIFYMNMFYLMYERRKYFINKRPKDKRFAYCFKLILLSRLLAVPFVWVIYIIVYGGSTLITKLVV